ncbi:GAP family protein [Streptomyces sp. NPDC048644]|uniref:GAP family protein n=1 Tax=Streptomyces sp. NPDC048644 TaxID=3365582 RepID=UPI003721052A
MNLLAVLPMAFVMVAGPQILSAIFLATSEKWQRNTAAYLVGAALSITLAVSVAYLASSGAPREGGSNDTVNVIVGVLLLAAMAHVFLTRKTSKPPKWMGKLETANPRLSFRLGFLLLGLFPTDIVTSVAVGAYLSSHGDPWWHLLPFLLLTLLFLALPALLLLAFGKRGRAFLPKVRDWMNTNSWVVSEIVIVFFIALTINSLVG